MRSILTRFGELIGAVIVALGPFSQVWAANVENGRRLAQSACASCHTVMPGVRREVALAPSFITIAVKYKVTPEMLAYDILSPHPRMGFIPTRDEAEDLAVYIQSLAK